MSLTSSQGLSQIPYFNHDNGTEREAVTFFIFKQLSFNQLLIILKEETSGADNHQISCWNALYDSFLQQFAFLIKFWLGFYYSYGEFP